MFKRSIEVINQSHTKFHSKMILNEKNPDLKLESINARDGRKEYKNENVKEERKD